MREPVRITGEGSLSRLPKELLGVDSRPRALLVHGTASFEKSGAEAILSDMPGVVVRHFGGVSGNPDPVVIERCAHELLSFKPHVVLAVGGGAVLDTAKAAIARAGAESTESLIGGTYAVEETRPRIWAVPTTAGSGSEETHFAVVYHDGNKYSIAHPLLRPDCIVLDPALTLSCGVSLTVESGADALCQSLESSWAGNATTESVALAQQAFARIVEAVPQVLAAPDSLDARDAMLQGANLAGRAINISKTTAGHALSYGLTLAFGLPHGLAVLSIMREIVPVLAPRVVSVENAEVFCDLADTLFDHRPLKEIAQQKRGQECIARLCAGVNSQRLGNHPVPLTETEIMEIYTAVLHRHGAS